MKTTTALAIDGGRPALDGLPPFPSWPQHSEADARALLDVFESGKWGSTHGDVVSQFETEFATAHGAKHGIALSNGTLALAAALRAAGVGVGDEVIVPPYTFIATASAALFVGAVPTFADVEPDTHLIDPASVERAITDRTKAIIAVHLAGSVANLDALNKLAETHGLTLIEDAAQATGAAWRGRPVGAIGDLGTFSFQSSKNITAGEGGIVVSDDDRLAGAVYSLVNVGRVHGGGWYEHASVGYNLRLTEFQGALLRGQLTRLPEQQKVRDENAKLLTERLAGVEGVVVDREPEEMTAHGRHLFMFRVPDLGAAGLRDAAAKALGAEGVAGASSGYVPLHRNEALLAESKALAARLGQPYPEADCPVSDLVCTDTIWFPQTVLLGTTEQTNAVADAITKVVSAGDALKSAH